MELIDTHCHIQSIGQDLGEANTRSLWTKAPRLSVSQVIKNAEVAGVRRLICVGCDLEDSRLAAEVASDHEELFASIGIHPHEASTYVNAFQKLRAFSSLATRPKVVAVGECGLDYFYGHSEPKDQQKLLHLQIELALEHNLPLIFHVREAFSDFWPIFDSYQGLLGVLHSYTDNMANLEMALTRNLLIGVNGIATFSKNPHQMAVYRAIPLQKLLLETDAPFLTPTPYRGTINESKYVRVVAEFLAELRQENLEDLAASTTQNANILFKLS